MHPLATPDAWEADGIYFPVGDHRIFLRRAGAGSAMLLLHGYPTSGYDFVKIAGALEGQFETFVPDLLGFGFSSKPRSHAYRIAEQADVAVAALERFGVRRFHVLAHDYGVTVAQELLARQREGRLAGIRSVAFLNGGLFPETHRPRAVQRILASPLGPLVAHAMTRRSYGRSLAAVFGPRTQPTEAELDAFFTLTARDGGIPALAGLIDYMRERRLRRERWVGALLDASVPMRFVNGVEDPVSGGHMIDRLLELAPASDVVRLPCGHYPQVELPADVLAAVLPFFQAIESDSATEDSR